MNLRTIRIGAAVCLMVASSAAQQINKSSDLHSLVAAERAFAALSVAKGIKVSFCTFLADSSIVFRPHPMNGKPAYAARPETPATLSWKPTVATIALNGELGFTSGPWIWTDSSPTPEAPAHGYYASIWKKQTDKSWKVVLDIGVSTPGPNAADSILLLPEFPDTAKKATLDEKGIAFERERLFGIDRMFSDQCRNHGQLEAYLQHLAFSHRVLRANQFPASTLSEIHQLFRDKGDRTVTWEPIGGEVAASGDFGYTYGKYTDQPKAMSTKPRIDEGYYFRVWNKEVQQWKTELDVFTLLPKKEN